MMKAQRAASVRRKKKINWKLESPLHIMMLPSVILLAIFCYYPMYGNIMAFQNFNPGLKFLGVVVNENDDSASAKSTLEYLVSETNCDIFNSKLRHRAPIDAATTMGIPVDEIRNGKRSYEELEAVYKEMLARIKKIG